MVAVQRMLPSSTAAVHCSSTATYLLQQEASYGGLQVLGHALGGAVGTVSGTEGIVHKDVGVGSQLSCTRKTHREKGPCQFSHSPALTRQNSCQFSGWRARSAWVCSRGAATGACAVQAGRSKTVFMFFRSARLLFSCLLAMRISRSWFV